MQRLVWQNSNGDEINLTSGNYGITNWEGFSNTSLNIQSQQVPFQDGGVFLDALMEQRELSVTLAMYDGGNLETRYRMRRELMHILNPKLGEGYLIYTNDFISKRIKCVAQIPLFETHNSNDSGTPKASLAWTACNPYWEDLEETEVNIIESGVEINNEGDVGIGVEIEFSSKENTPIKNPQIINNTNGEEIKYNGEENEKIIINTNVGKKSAYVESLSVEELSSDSFGKYNEYYSCYLKLSDGILYKSLDLINWQELRNSDSYYYDRFYTIGNNVLLLQGYEKNNESSFMIDITTDLVTWFMKALPKRFDVDITLLPQSMKRYVIMGCTRYKIYSCIFDFSENPYFGNWQDTSVSAQIFVLSILFNPRLNKVFVRLIYEESFNNLCFCTSDGFNWQRKGNINFADSNQKFTYQKETGMMVAYGSKYGSIDSSIDGEEWDSVSLYFGINCIYYSSTMKKYIIVGWTHSESSPDPFIGLCKHLPKSMDEIETLNLGSFIVPFIYNDDSTHGQFYDVEEIRNKGEYIISGEYTNLEGVGGKKVIKTKIDLRINRIQNISDNSNMNFKLETGRNFITARSDYNCKLTYRQKYIGV